MVTVIVGSVKSLMTSNAIMKI